MKARRVIAAILLIVTVILAAVVGLSFPIAAIISVARAIDAHTVTAMLVAKKIIQFFIGPALASAIWISGVVAARLIAD